MSYFTVPTEMKCCTTRGAMDHKNDGRPYVMFHNDSLKRFHPDPDNRWAANTWDTRNAYAIQY